MMYNRFVFLAVSMFLTVPAFAASPAQQAQGERPEFDYGFQQVDHTAKSNFTLYGFDGNGDQKAVDASKRINLLVDVATGQEYIIILGADGQPVTVTPRLHNDTIPFCENQDGFYCSQQNGPVGASGPDRRLLTHERELFELSQSIVASFKNFFFPFHEVEKKN